MRAVDIIVKKRDGGELTAEEIDFFIQGYTRDEIPDYQASALCMAIYFQGMTAEETIHLTHSMAFSGATLDLHDVSPFVVDKHSSGGVGDKTTLVVGPIVASWGQPVGKMSGRALAFSGGTLDKLESIRGFRAELSLQEFKDQLRQVGLVVAGQTHDLAPADRKLYALRDVTGTVPSLPLIASSIMSKKIASGADAIVLDVKVGSGAFMKELFEAEKLARLMVRIGEGMGRRMAAVLSDMDQPLGLAVGNALELKEAIATLHGAGPADFRQLVVTVAGEMLYLSGKAARREEGQRMAAQALDSHQAWTKFRDFIQAQGGNVDQVDHPEKLPQAPLVEPLLAPQDGWIAAINAQEVGLTVVALGGGREKKGDAIDYSVGIVLANGAKVGDRVQAGQPLCSIHARSQQTLEAAKERLLVAYRFSQTPVQPPQLIKRIVSEASQR
ncbi:MAG TPA: thymidine phosphorylase [Anaerolineae bacterium]|nr:thymidine phosphorylase [Anaerolineae bacterium]HIQ06680.1 thymidine phosphorylase [Anaerolineae bacterium]